MGIIAKLPGALRAAVHSQPRYNANPSSAMILKSPRPRNASGFVCRLILRTSKGRRKISPIPIKLQIRRVINEEMPSCCCMEHGFACPLAKCRIKISSVMFREIVSHPKLPAVLVYSLRYLSMSIVYGESQPCNLQHIQFQEIRTSASCQVRQ